MARINTGIFSQPRARKLVPTSLQKEFSRGTFDPNKDLNPIIIAHYFSVCKRVDWFAVEGFFVMPADWDGPGKVVTGFVNQQVVTKKITNAADMALVQDYCFYGMVCEPGMEMGNWWLSDFLSIKDMPGIRVEYDRYYSKGHTLQEELDKRESPKQGGGLDHAV
jgi:hypothetical protein